MKSHFSQLFVGDKDNVFHFIWEQFILTMFNCRALLIFLFLKRLFYFAGFTDDYLLKWMHNKMATDLMCPLSFLGTAAKCQLFKSLPQDLVETGDDHNWDIYFDQHSGSDSLASLSLCYLWLSSSVSFRCSVALCYAWFSWFSWLVFLMALHVILVLVHVVLLGFVILHNEPVSEDYKNHRNRRPCNESWCQ